MTQKVLMEFLERIFCHWIFETHSVSIPSWVFNHHFELALIESLGRHICTPVVFCLTNIVTSLTGDDNQLSPRKIFVNCPRCVYTCWTALAETIPSMVPLRGAINGSILPPSRSMKAWLTSRTVLSEYLFQKDIWKRVRIINLLEPVEDDYLRREGLSEFSTLQSFEKQ